MFALLMIGAGILVPEIERARMLEFPWMRPLRLIPFISLVSYVVVGLWLRRKIGALGWVAGFVIALAMFFIPTCMMSLNTRSLELDRWLQPDEMIALKARLVHPFFHYSSSSDGMRLVVRKSDYSEALVEYMRTNQVRAMNQP